ncbi:hypothetical protein R5M74_17220 [Aeromonas hydrophila]|nr:hypothetical protein R5M74_17220 [Aeromonas hydrophila]
MSLLHLGNAMAQRSICSTSSRLLRRSSSVDGKEQVPPGHHARRQLPLLSPRSFDKAKHSLAALYNNHANVVTLR